MGPNFHCRYAETAFIVGAPLTLAVVELFHPRADDLLQLEPRIWLAVHYAQLLLFPLAALAIARLLRSRTDIAALVARAALFTFAVSYVAFDTAAGIVTGILVDAAQTSDMPESFRPAIDAIWNHPIVGATAEVPVLAAVAIVSLCVGGVAAAVSLKRGGSRWAPIALLALSGFGLVVFRSHAWPGGPLTFGGFAIAAAWLEWARMRNPMQRVP
jgi:hypothetical protein